MGTRFGMFAAGLLLLLAGFGNAALAAGVTPFAIPSGDATVTEVLAPIFGEAVGGAGSGSSIGGLFGSFNAALLFVGGILTAYGILAGTAQTAHDGEVLGRRWSTLWVPIRVAVGLALIVPVSGGYCTAQTLVAWLGQQGVAIAAGMWSGYAKDYLPAPSEYKPVNIPGVRALALGLLNSDICALAYRHYMTLSDPTGGDDGGRVAMSEVEAGHFALGSGQVGTAFCGGYATNDVMSNDPAGVGQAHEPAFKKLAARMQTLAERVADLNQSIDQKTTNVEINAAVAEYEQAVSAAATLAVATANARSMDLAQSASVGGWIMAGAHYSSHLQAVNSVSAGVGAAPKPLAPDLSGASPDVAAHVSSMMARADAASSGSNDFLKGPSLWDRTKGAVSGVLDAGSKLVSGEIGPGLLMGYISQSFSGFTSAFANVRNAQGDAITNLHHLGVAAMEAAVVGFGLAVVLGIISTTGGLVLAGISTALFSFGAVNGIYLPVLPAVLWMSAVVGWFILFVECMIAAPIWALMHVHMDGEGIAGRGSSGYEIILGLVLRPALMTFGFSISLSAATPLINLWNRMFYAAAANSFDDPNGILIQIAMFCVYCVTMVAILHRLFALIHIIPDQLSRWWSGGHESLGADSAEHIGRQSHAGATAALGAATGVAVNLARHGGGSGKGKSGSGNEAPSGERLPVVSHREPPKESGDTSVDKFSTDTSKSGQELSPSDGVVPRQRAATNESGSADTTPRVAGPDQAETTSTAERE